MSFQPVGSLTQAIEQRRHYHSNNPNKRYQAVFQELTAHESNYAGFPTC